MIGTYAWIDGTGLLRMRDYIADNAGYRILKSKNLYVGVDRPISEAVKMAKKAPSTPDTLIPSIPKTTYQSTTPYPSIRYTPVVRILPNSLPSGQDTPSTVASTTPPPVYISSTTPRNISYTPTESNQQIPSTYNIPSSTPSPKQFLPSAPASVTILSTPTETPPTIYIQEPTISTVSPPINSNSIDFSSYSGDPQYEHYKDDLTPFYNPYIFRNGPTYPLDKNGQTFTGYPSNYIGNDYEAHGSNNNEISVTNDGFRYYIPRAYHEETNLRNNEKAGSFGYIDPFGIRRVVYYHASPEGGFKHRKNNRYVGFRAPPYDPSPY